MSDDDRPKRSWRERDASRNRSRHVAPDDRGRGGTGERSRAATEAYKRKLGLLFSGAPGGAPATPGLSAACAAYREALGMPQDASLLALFLDATDRDVVLAALAALSEMRAAATPGAIPPGLRSQAGMLAEGTDDEIAEAAEALLARL
jgi:hypothetical protein